MGRAPCCDKSKVKKGPWSPEEDSKLKEFIDKYGTGGNWIALPHKAGLKRCGKSCRLRWLNYLRPNIKHGEFSDVEERTICALFASIGSRWSIIASQLPGRTDNDIKNYWNTKLKKKLLGIPSSQKKTSFLQQQQHQQLVLPSPYLPYNTFEPSSNLSYQALQPISQEPLSSSSSSSSPLFQASEKQVKLETGSSTVLAFGGEMQNWSTCSEQLDFSNFLLKGFEEQISGMQNSFLEEFSCFGYDEIKQHLLNSNNGEFFLEEQRRQQETEKP
ncbi:hypothetical protein HPP92_022582 [Vanilla planifolia]|uniref:Uncharacterized protein n=1 Tax=Vanilla planifolia TaxID=51239 RepID=A0A835PRS6_VANPL|nr:hypothetical protein HPP92_022582 [Vanilla planifolia]